MSLLYFYVGTLWLYASEGVNERAPSGVHAHIREKFRFRRKCDKDSVVQLFAHSAVVNSTAQTVLVAGRFEIIYRIR